MQQEIKKVCIIGAGVMGSAIAAIIANAKHHVLLLDIVTQDTDDRNKVAVKALTKLQESTCTALTHPTKAQFITIGNLDDDLDLIKECDLVIEAIIEKLEIKHQLFNKIVPYLNDTAILASNTSTLSLASLKSQLPIDLRKRFIILHFFNPPRFMELLELVTDHETERQSLANVTSFITNDLGKIIIKCKDTPGFIANRVGCFLLELVVRNAIVENLNPVVIDKIFSDLLKLPRTGIFGLYDLIGHDVMKLISTSLLAALLKDDQYRVSYINVDCLNKMAELRLQGRKTKAGFYRINEQKVKEVINFNDLSYSPIADTKLEFTTIDELLISEDVYGRFFNKILVQFYSYLMSLVPSVTENITDIDLAMKLGYSWEIGPFELLFKHITKLDLPDNNCHPEQHNKPHSELVLGSRSSLREMLKQVQDESFVAVQSSLHHSKIILENNSARLFEYKEKIIFSITTKMNCLNNDVFNLLLAALDYAEERKQDIYLFSQTPHFSAGADLKFIKHCMLNGDLDAVSNFILLGQKAMMRMKYAGINVISCASGVALGGGCELLLHSDLVIAHQNLNAGLVEVSVGLVPGWGGIKEMFIRANGDKEQLVKNIRNIVTYNKSQSADYFVVDYQIDNYEIIANRYSMLDYALSINIPRKITRSITISTIPKFDILNELDTSTYNAFQMYVLSEIQKIIDAGNNSEYGLLIFEHDIFLKTVLHNRKRSTVL